MSDRLLSLKTKTPEEGFALAISLAQKGVVVTQPNEKNPRKTATKIFPKC